MKVLVILIALSVSSVLCEIEKANDGRRTHNIGNGQGELDSGTKLEHQGDDSSSAGRFIYFGGYGGNYGNGGERGGGHDSSIAFENGVKGGGIGGRSRVNVRTVIIPRPVPILQPYSVTINHPVPIPHAVLYPVEVPRPIPVAVPHAVPVEVPRPVPVLLHRPYPVLIPRPVTVPVETPRPVAVQQKVPHSVGDLRDTHGRNLGGPPGTGKTIAPEGGNGGSHSLGNAHGSEIKGVYAVGTSDGGSKYHISGAKMSHRYQNLRYALKNSKL